jgi:glycyl-tRNA synthetase beta chain
MFGIGNLPTGDKDPFALRRHALGLSRMLIECKLQLDIAEIVGIAANKFGAMITDRSAIVTAVCDFTIGRVAINLRDQGYAPQVVDAVLYRNEGYLFDVPAKLAAVKVFATLPEAASLASANKRIKNILSKSENAWGNSVDPALLHIPEEKVLHSAIYAVATQADKALADGDYAANLQALAALKAPVDAFFDKVMVNAEDPTLKANRLGLLATLHNAMNRVADLSKLAS